MPRQDTRSAKQTEGRGRERDAYGFLRSYQQSGSLEYAPTQPDIEQSQVQLGDVTFGRGANQIGGTNVSAELANLMYAGISAAEGVAKVVKTVTEDHDTNVANDALDAFSKEKESDKWKAMTPQQREARTAEVYAGISDKVWNERNQLNYKLKSQEFQDKVDPTKFEYLLQSMVVGRQAIISSDMTDEEKAAQLKTQTEAWQATLDANFSDNPELHQKGLLALYGFKIDDHTKTASAISSAFTSVFPIMEDFTASVTTFFADTRDQFPDGTSNEELWQRYYTWLGSQGNPLPEFFEDEVSFAATWGSRYTDAFVQQKNRMAKQYAEQNRAYKIVDAQSKLNAFRGSIKRGFQTGAPLADLPDLAPDFLDHLNTLVLSDPTGTIAETELIATLGSLVPSMFRDVEYTAPPGDDPKPVFDALIKEKIAKFVNTLDFLPSPEQRERVLKAIRDKALSEYSEVTPSGSRRDFGASPAPGSIDVYTDKDGKPERFDFSLESHIDTIPVGPMTRGAIDYHRELGVATSLDMYRRGSTHLLSTAAMANDSAFLKGMQQATGLNNETILNFIYQAAFDIPNTQTPDETLHNINTVFKTRTGKDLPDEQRVALRRLVSEVQSDPLLSNTASLYRAFEDGSFITDKSPLRAASDGIYAALERSKDDIRKYPFTLDGRVIITDVRETEAEQIKNAIIKGDIDFILDLQGIPDTFYDSSTFYSPFEYKDFARQILSVVGAVDAILQTEGQKLTREQVEQLLEERAPDMPADTIRVVQNVLKDLRIARQRAETTEDPEAAYTEESLRILNDATDLIATRIQRTQYGIVTEKEDGFKRVDWDPETRDAAWDDFSYIADDPQVHKALESVLLRPNWGDSLRATFGDPVAFGYVDSLSLGESPNTLGLVQYLDRNGFELSIEYLPNRAPYISGFKPKADSKSLRESPILAFGVKTPDGAWASVVQGFDNFFGTTPLEETETRGLKKDWQITTQTDANGNTTETLGQSIQTSLNSISSIEAEGDLDSRDANALRGVVGFIGRLNDYIGRPDQTGLTVARVDSIFMGRPSANKESILPLFNNNEDAFNLVQSIYRAKKAKNEPFTVTMEDLVLIEMSMKGRARAANVNAQQDEYYSREIFQLPDEENTRIRADISMLTGQRAYVADFNVEGTDIVEKTTAEIFPYVQEPVYTGGLKVYRSYNEFGVSGQTRARYLQSREDPEGPVLTTPEYTRAERYQNKRNQARNWMARKRAFTYTPPTEEETARTARSTMLMEAVSTAQYEAKQQGLSREETKLYVTNAQFEALTGGTVSGIDLGLSVDEMKSLINLNQKDFEYMIDYYTKYSS